MRIAVWGLGRHAIKNILPALRQNKNLKLYGVFSRNKDTVGVCTKKFECRSWKNSQEMLSDKNLVVIFAASPIGIHSDQGRRTLESNKHFWCEKPFTTSLEHTEELASLSDIKGLTIAEGFMYLYHNQFIWLKEYLENYKNEDIKLINCNFCIPYSDNPGFRYDPKLGGSTLLDIGTYLLSAIFSLVREEDPKILLKEIKKNNEFKVDMNGFICLAYPSGILCNLFWGMGYAYRNEIDILTHNSSLYTNKIFSKPSSYVPEFKIKNVNGESSIIQINKCNHFVNMFDHFYSLITSEEKAHEERNRILHLAKWTQKIKDM